MAHPVTESREASDYAEDSGIEDYLDETGISRSVLARGLRKALGTGLPPSSGQFPLTTLLATLEELDTRSTVANHIIVSAANDFAKRNPSALIPTVDEMIQHGVLYYNWPGDNSWEETVEEGMIVRYGYRYEPEYNLSDITHSVIYRISGWAVAQGILPDWGYWGRPDPSDHSIGVFVETPPGIGVSEAFLMEVIRRIVDISDSYNMVGPDELRMFSTHVTMRSRYTGSGPDKYRSLSWRLPRPTTAINTAIMIEEEVGKGD